MCRLLDEGHYAAEIVTSLEKKKGTNKNLRE